MRNYGFNTAIGSSYRLGPCTISACISEDQVVVPGQRVRLRLLQSLQAGKVIVPAGNLITGIVALQGERGSLGTNVSITRSAGQQLAMDLSRSVMQGGSQFLSQKLRSVKIKLKVGYKVLLVSKQP